MKKIFYFFLAAINVQISLCQEVKLKLPVGQVCSVKSVSYSNDSKTILMASDDKTAKIWDITSGKLIHSLKANNDIRSVMYSPDGMFIATASDDFTVNIWDASTAKLLYSLGENYADYNSLKGPVSYSPDGRSILTCSSDSTAKIWDASDGKLLRSFKWNTAFLLSAVFSPDGKTVVSSAYNDTTAKVWDTSTGTLLHSLVCGKLQQTYFVNGDMKVDSTKEPEKDLIFIMSATYSPDGKTIVTYSSDRSAKIWNATTGNLIYSVDSRSFYISPVFSHDGRTIILGNRNYTLIGQPTPVYTPIIYDATIGKMLFSLEGHVSTITSVTFSPDDKNIITTSADRTAKIWDALTGKMLYSLEGHSGSVNSATYSIDGKQVVTIGDDNKTIFWDAQSGKMLDQLYIIGENDWLNLTDDKYYYGSTGAIKELYWIVDNKKIYSFEQFDLKYNRPDIVLSRLENASPKLIEAYRQAYLNRLKHMGFTENQLRGESHLRKITNFEFLPNLKETKNGEIEVDLSFNDSKNPLN